jgi:hypothetical protein
MAYIRPFIKFIAHFQSIDGESNVHDAGYLFCNAQDQLLTRGWTNSQKYLTPFIGRFAVEMLDPKSDLGTSSYRHFSAAVARKYIPLIGPFFEGDKDACAELLQGKLWAQGMRAAQTNHSFQTNIRHYGTEAKFHPDVQKDHFDSFVYLSNEWQRLRVHISVAAKSESQKRVTTATQTTPVRPFKAARSEPESPTPKPRQPGIGMPTLEQMKSKTVEQPGDTPRTVRVRQNMGGYLKEMQEAESVIQEAESVIQAAESTQEKSRMDFDKWEEMLPREFGRTGKMD